MISQGKQYLTTAWWLSFWPGLAIILTTLSLNLLSNWMRIALDPVQRWRLEMRGTRMAEHLLGVRNLSVDFHRRLAPSTPCAMSAFIWTGARRWPFLGESGSGKSVSRRRS